MKKKSIAILAAILVVYVLIGGAILHGIEGSNETESKTTASNTYYNFSSLINGCATQAQLETFVKAIITAYDSGIYVTSSEESATQWDYGNSVFFAMTAVTTIGYGNQSPATSGGKAFVCIFALLGIPMMAVLLAAIGEKLNGLIKPLYDKKFKMDYPKVEHGLKILIVIVILFVLFIFIPAAVFYAVEEWSYGDAIYYSIITLTTVGFGDFVIGTEKSDYRIAYKLLTSVWIVFGLSAVSMLLSGIQDFYQNNFASRVEKEEKSNEEESDTKGKDDIKMEIKDA